MRYYLPFLLACLIPGALAAQVRTASAIRMTAPRAAATAVATDAVLVQWSPVSDANQYRVSRGIDPNGPFVPVGEAVDGQAGFRDGGLVPGTRFHYRIEAVAGAPVSAIRSVQRPGAPLAILTTSAMTAPAPSPSGFRTCAEDPRCLAWQPVPGAASYAIYVKYPAPAWLESGPDQPERDGQGCILMRHTVSIPSYVPGSTGACRQEYRVAAIFELRDFPTRGAGLTVEGPVGVFSR